MNFYWNGIYFSFLFHLEVTPQARYCNKLKILKLGHISINIENRKYWQYMALYIVTL